VREKGLAGEEKSVRERDGYARSAGDNIPSCEVKIVGTPVLAARACTFALYLPLLTSSLYLPLARRCHPKSERNEPARETTIVLTLSHMLLRW